MQGCGVMKLNAIDKSCRFRKTGNLSTTLNKPPQVR